jgi:regulator of ribonuclease activity A
MTPPYTADLCDAHEGRVQVILVPFQSFGARPMCAGPISTVETFEDNSRIREALAEPGLGRVLLVDGGGSLDRALVGGDLAGKAAVNGWAGVVVFGAVRDLHEIARTDVALFALGACPRKSDRQDRGRRDVAVTIGGVEIAPGGWLYADRDGIVVAAEPLHAGA